MIFSRLLKRLGISGKKTAHARARRRRILPASIRMLLLLSVLVFAGIGLPPKASAILVTRPSQSTPIALSNNDQFLINVNPDDNTIKVFSVNGPPTKVNVGREPNSVAIHSNNTTAYVANTLDGTVSVVDLQLGQVTRMINVGAEPMALTTSPNGTRLYVANSSSNNLMVVDTATDIVLTAINLNPFGTSPRAIAVTNDGDSDDSDETIFVALFFAQLRPGTTAAQEGQDDQREGRVVAISAATNTVLGVTTLGPLANTGFNANGRLAPASGQSPNAPSTNPQTFTTSTGAFPNQLADIAINPVNGYAYVVSTGASPNGPLRFNSNNQGLVSVFNTVNGSEVTAGQTDPTWRRTAPLNLNQGVNLATNLTPRLFHTNPVAMAWRPDGSDAWAVVQNSDLVVRLTVDANGIPTIGAPLVTGSSQITRVDLQSVDASVDVPGKAPRGIVIDSTGTFAYVLNFISRSVTLVDISNATAPKIVATSLTAALPTPGTPEATVLLGGELFFTGRGPQGRMSSESWGACIVCHPNGRSDNVTWMFGDGARQTISLDGTVNKKNPNDLRILNWSGTRDENHDFELNTRGVFGGRGLIDDDRLFLAIGGASGPPGGETEPPQILQFNQFTGSVNPNNDLAAGVALPNLSGFTPRRDFAIATLDDARVFIIGGRTGPGQGNLVSAADAVLEFNPRTNAITRRSSSGFTRRHSLGAAAVRTNKGFRIYAVGGYSSTSPTDSPTGEVGEFDPVTGTWRIVASLPTAVAQFGITVAGGINGADPLQLIHVVSGNAGSEATPSLPPFVQRFQADPTGAGTWTPFSPTGLTPRRNHGAATALRGVTSRVFVIGGQNAAGTVLNAVEEYTAQEVSFVTTPHTALPSPRARFGIGSSLTTNQIYVMGGVDGSGVDQPTFFQYTPAENGPVAGPAGTPSGTWAAGTSLQLARHGLQVTTPPGVTNFLPNRNTGRDARQDAIASWIFSAVRAWRAPVSANDPTAMQGRQLFGQVGLVVPGFSCATCHGGAKWTRSTVDYNAPPSPDINLGLGNEVIIGAELRQTATQGPNVLNNVGTFSLSAGRVNEIRLNSADISQAIAPLGANGFNIPSLLSVHQTAPYFYAGQAQTLEQVLDGSQDGFGGVRHHFVANSADRGALIAFLRSIDDTTPPVVSGPRVTVFKPSGTVQPPVNAVEVTFDRPMNPATFTESDIVVFAGPGGGPIVAAVSPVAGTNNKFNITFASQTQAGNRTLVFGPNIEDTSGNQMDQDNDLIVGEIPDDRFTGTFTVGVSSGGGPRVTVFKPSGTVQPPVDAVEVTFDRPMNPATFTESDIVVFAGPGGGPIVAAVSPVAGTNNKFNITFASQTQAGNRTLVFGPNIEDTSGNRMDQDGDLITGEDPDDRFTGTFTIAGAASDVTPIVRVIRGGFRLNQSTRRFEQPITITTMSSGAIVGPVSLVLDNLSSNVTLFNRTGVTTLLSPIGSPFININVGSDGLLSPGETAIVLLEFTNPSNQTIRYDTRVVAGTGVR